MKKVKQDNSTPNLSGQDSKKIAAAAPRNDNSTGVYQLIDIGKIQPSKLNYRKTFNAKAQEELTESIKSKGVLQPISVRPLKGNGSFEIVIGSRRYCGAKDAGLKQIPCMVKELSDAEALEIQVIENSQREDVNPMEEAMGFKRLIEMGKHTHETLAKKLGKSLSYVFGRLSLAKLPEEVQKAVLGEKISLGHALILTRLRHPSEQKEMLQAIIQQEMSVREAAGSLDDFENDINKAVFDTAACEKCPYLSRNQAVLFPELKKSGECMDKGCFFAKTRDFYKAITEEKKKEGFKIFTDAKEVEGLIKKYVRICPPESSEYYEKPKKYKSECMKCKENHAYFIYEKDSNYYRKSIEFGEICLDKKCLDAMNRTKTQDSNIQNSNEGSGRISPHTIAAHARACRDRFLRANFPAKVEASEVLQKRFTIYHVLATYNSFFLDEGQEGFMKGLNPSFNKNKNKYSVGQDVIYGFVAWIPAARLDEALKRILVIAIQWADEDVLLRMTPEAGIDMAKDFGPDEEFLNSKTKDELMKFIGTHKLTVEMKESEKKGNIVKAILVQDLKGKLTKELKEAVEIEEGNAT